MNYIIPEHSILELSQLFQLSLLCFSKICSFEIYYENTLGQYSFFYFPLLTNRWGILLGKSFPNHDVLHLIFLIFLVPETLQHDHSFHLL